MAISICMFLPSKKTYNDLLKETTARGVIPLDAELILCFVSGWDSRAAYAAHATEPVRWTLLQWLRFWHAHAQCKRRVPVAYITGKKEFYGTKFLVSKQTLCPRPETEHLVDAARESLANATGRILLIDVGTGSGCIPIALLNESVSAPGAKGAQIHAFATDISRRALRVAQKNAVVHKTPIMFLRGNLLVPFLRLVQQKNQTHLLQSALVCITANLPYLTEEQYRSEPSIGKEPKRALVAGNGGLALYEKLIVHVTQLVVLLKPNTPVHLFLEIDPSQTERIQNLLRAEFPNAEITVQKDLAGHDRVVCAALSAPPS